MVISDYNTPVMYIDPSGFEMFFWYSAVALVVGLVIVTMIVCGGVGVALFAISMALQGATFSGLSAAATILVFASAGSAIALAGSALYAGISSSSWDEFADYGLMGLFSTATGGILGAYVGYLSYNAGLQTYGTHSTNETGTADSTYTQLSPKDNSVMRITRYDSKGNQAWRIDFTGRAHYYEPFKETVLPHIHVFSYNVYKEFTNTLEKVYPFGK